MYYNVQGQSLHVPSYPEALEMLWGCTLGTGVEH